MELDIEKALAECQSGNLVEFSVIFDAFYKKIYQFVYFRTLHKETAEDLTSVIFVKTLEHITTFNKQKAQFSTWIFQIARNTVIDFYRSKKESVDIEDVWDLQSSDNLEQELDMKEKLEQVKGYLQTLPARQREIVIMRVWDGLSHKEIAEILEISEANSKMIFSRVLTELTQKIPQVLIYMLILKNIWNN